MEYCAAVKLAPIENGTSAEYRSKKASCGAKEDRKEFRAASELRSVKVRLLKKGCTTKINITGKDSSPEIRDAPEGISTKIYTWKDEPFEIQICRACRCSCCTQQFCERSCKRGGFFANIRRVKNAAFSPAEHGAATRSLLPIRFVCVDV